IHNRRGIVHHEEFFLRRPADARDPSPVSCSILSRSWWLKNSSFVRVRAPSSRFKSSPTFLASAFSASAEALSGSECSNSDNSRPLSWPSSQAVHFSSNVFINVPQQILQFLACIKQTRHHRANGAPQSLCNLVVLHVFGFLHQNDGPLFG